MELSLQERDVMVAVSELVKLAEFLAGANRPEAKPIIEVILKRVHDISRHQVKVEMVNPNDLTTKIAKLIKRLGLNNSAIIRPS